MKWIIGVFWWLAGFILVAINDVVTPKGARQWRFLDSIYGNPYDPLDGDSSYKSHTGDRFRRYRWSQLRNPVNNYLRSVGPNGKVQKVFSVKHTQYVVVDGKRYGFTQYPLPFGLYWWWGYKVMEDWRERERAGVVQQSRLIVGHHFDTQLILWPFKNKKV